MRRVRFFVGICPILVFASALVRSSPQGQSGKPTPLILENEEGEQREFRTRPGTFFTLKVDPKSGGSERMVVIAEEMAPGDKIPTHRHPDADELIIIHAGTARVTLGDKVQEARAGAIVFIPKGTWIGVENIGKANSSPQVYYQRLDMKNICGRFRFRRVNQSFLFQKLS